MNSSVFSLVSAFTAGLLAAAPATLSAQTRPQDTLLFSTRNIEETLSGTGGAGMLAPLGPRAVAMFTPRASSAGASAEKFLPAIAVQMQSSPQRLPGGGL